MWAIIEFTSAPERSLYKNIKFCCLFSSSSNLGAKGLRDVRNLMKKFRWFFLKSFLKRIEKLTWAQTMLPSDEIGDKAILVLKINELNCVSNAWDRNLIWGSDSTWHGMRTLLLSNSVCSEMNRIKIHDFTNLEYWKFISVSEEAFNDDGVSFYM